MMLSISKQKATILFSLVVAAVIPSARATDPLFHQRDNHHQHVHHVHHHITHDALVPHSRAARRMLQRQAADRAVTNSWNAQRFLQFWNVDYTPDVTPEFICNGFEANSSGAYSCDCSIAPDRSIDLACEEVEPKCNIDDSICYQQTVNVGLNNDVPPKVDELETCTNYVNLNLTRFETSSTKLANYSDIFPCVSVTPKAPGDFSELTGCSVTINGTACQKCEICTTEEGGPGISLDCCNTNPNGEQLKIKCGPVGVGGAFVPIFDTYEEGNMETCSGSAPSAYSSKFWIPLLALGIVSLAYAGLGWL